MKRVPPSVPGSASTAPLPGSTKRWTGPDRISITGSRSVGSKTPKIGTFAADAASYRGRSASNGIDFSATGSRVIGAIQRSISRSNTERVPIQKIANSNPPSTTPDQVCSQFIEARKPGSTSASARQAHEAEGPSPGNDPDGRKDEAEAHQARLGKAPDQQAEVDEEGQHRDQDDGFAGRHRRRHRQDAGGQGSQTGRDGIAAADGRDQANNDRDRLPGSRA